MRSAQRKLKKKNQVSLVSVIAQVAKSLPFSHLTPTVNQSEIRKGHLLLTWSPGWQGRSCHQGHQSSWGVSCGSLPHRGCFRHRCYGRCATKAEHNILLQLTMMKFWQIDLKERIRYLPGEVHLLCLDCLQQIQWKSKLLVTSLKISCGFIATQNIGCQQGSVQESQVSVSKATQDGFCSSMRGGCGSTG